MLHSAAGEPMENKPLQQASNTETQESFEGQKKGQSWRKREKDCPQATAAEELMDLPYPDTLLRYWHRKAVQLSCLVSSKAVLFYFWSVLLFLAY